MIVCNKYQIWLRGIVTHNGSRYELDMPGPKTMVGSESLHTTGSYPNLIAYGGNTKKHKAAIAVILVMFFEASRLQELHDLSFRLLREKDDELVGETNKHLINDWCDTSRDFYEESGGAEGVITIAESTGVATKKVAKSVRVLCRSRWDEWVKDNVPAVNPTWEVWKHRNDCVFDNSRPNILKVVSMSTEGGLWCMAGASKLQELMSRLSRSLPLKAAGRLFCYSVVFFGRTSLLSLKVYEFYKGCRLAGWF
ncbi:hypothetical protein SETIT_3G363000v2 [Setaria italica]|uniref:Uncharacterized protein n=1 Tax=Setaria italica TaxID=4555 RepID=A0A368QMY5_SETIT|nr:hypothetical protein SETIT_3G363000v2 [Setaria italica]